MKPFQQKPSVLIVDDDALVLDSLKDVLEPICDTFATESPVDALNQLELQNFDILITDYLMPQYSGIILTQRAKKICPNILPIIATGYANKEIALNALRHGAYDFIEKPIFPEILIASINRAWTQIKTAKYNKELLEDVKIYALKLEEQNKDLDIKNQELQTAQKALKENNVQLEIQYAQLQKAQAEIQQNAMKAGMAEVSMNILHNVGNILNSINVSTNLLSEIVTNSKCKFFFNTLELLEAHQNHLAEFLVNDTKGALVLPLLNEVKLAIQAEQNLSIRELQRLTSNIEHIKAIITLQQGYAIKPQFQEELSIQSIIEDALALLEGELKSSHIIINFDKTYDFQVITSKHKVLLILINLLRNAKDSIVEANPKERIINISISSNPISISITDNGLGVEDENLTKLFAHGFTTKKLGHGFGLHSCYLTIQELGGKIFASSAGKNQGAKFTIQL